MFISIAQAAETAGQTAAEPGMFSFSNPEFWVALTWLIVVGALAPKIYRALAAGLDARRDRIKRRMDEAERLRDEAQELLLTTQKRQRDAKNDAEDLIAHAKSEAQRLAVQASKDLDDLLVRRGRQATDRIAQAEADAVREVRAAAVDIAIAAATRLISQNLSGAQASSVFDRQVQELPARLH